MGSRDKRERGRARHAAQLLKTATPEEVAATLIADDMKRRAHPERVAAEALRTETPGVVVRAIELHTQERNGAR